MSTFTTCLLAPATLALALTAYHPSALAQQGPAAKARPAAAAKPMPKPVGLIDFDLSTTKYKYPIVIKAPAGTKLTDYHSPVDGPELGNDKVTFEIDDVSDPVVFDGTPEEQLKKERQSIKTEGYPKFIKFVLEQPDGFIAQTAGGYYMPVRYVKVNDKTYKFYTIPLHAPESESAARQLYDMAGQARAK